MNSLSELASFIGAAAWLPQIFAWGYKVFIRASLTVYPAAFAEIGYSSLGPICNIRMALDVKNRDLIINKMRLEINHDESGARSFQWVGINQALSQITDAIGNRQVVSRDQVPTALRVQENSILEVFVRFQELKFIEACAEVDAQLLNQFSYLRETRPEDFPALTIKTKEFHDAVKKRKDHFWWREGSYSVTLLVESSRKFKYRGYSACFSLSRFDVEKLRQNIVMVGIAAENVIMSNSKEFKLKPETWQWVNATITSR